MIALRLLGLLWSLPVSLVGLVVVAFCRPRRARLRWLGFHGVRGLLEFDVGRVPGGYGATTYGHVQAYREGVDLQRVRRHEDVHTLQGDLFGVLDIPIYGVCSLISRLTGGGWYRGNAMEKWAYAWQERPLEGGTP